jgi:hypothetical protein
MEQLNNSDLALLKKSLKELVHLNLLMKYLIQKDELLTNQQQV